MYQERTVPRSSNDCDKNNNDNEINLNELKHYD